MLNKHKWSISKVKKRSLFDRKVKKLSFGIVKKASSSARKIKKLSFGIVKRNFLSDK